MLRHARIARLRDVISEAGELLLEYAMDRGLWGLVREAAESITSDSLEFYPHFFLAKSYRMTSEFARALTHYEIAERNAPTEQDRLMARYDRASVLCESGRRVEGDVLYREMLDSSDPSIRSSAQVALALGA